VRKLSRSADSRLAVVAAAILAEDARLQALRPKGDAVVNRIRVLASPDVDKLLEKDGRERSVRHQQAEIARMNNQLNIDAQTIAQSFASWGRLKELLQSHGSEAQSILAEGSRANYAKQRVHGEIKEINKSLNTQARFNLNEAELVKLDELLSLKPAPNGPVTAHLAVPRPNGDVPSENIRFVRQHLRAYESLQQELPLVLRKGPYDDSGLADLVEFIRRTYPPSPTDQEFGKKLDALKQSAIGERSGRTSAGNH
jgi:hypothetical protein